MALIVNQLLRTVRREQLISTMFATFRKDRAGKMCPSEIKKCVRKT